MIRAAFALTLVLLAAGVPPVAQSATTISLELLADGTCSIAMRGAGGRSEMSYRPRTPGRCPIPSTRDGGPVHLDVLLPRGAGVPRRSVPELEWSVVDDRPRGTARLASPPEFVDIMPPASPRGWRRVAFAALVFALAVGAAWVFARGRFRRSSA